jgi:hypothetical protein
VIPDDDKVDIALAADEDADLAVGLAGDLAEVPGKLEGENPVRRDFAAVELLDAPDLAGLETGDVAINAVDATSSKTSCACVLRKALQKGSGYRGQGTGKEARTFETSVLKPVA